MSGKIVNEKVEFTPAGVTHSYEIVRATETSSSITVTRESDGYIMLEDSYGGSKISIPVAWAAHIGGLIIAAGAAQSDEQAA